jgi:glycosyltransferase involved in cell wall biosynthesis
MSSLASSQRPQVTVVTPAYNVAKYIGEAIDSVLMQTFTNFEYVVVDDGSTDGTAETALTHAGHDDRFRLVQLPHAGQSAARNVGIRESRAEYIAFLDGDDRWHRNFLERQLSLIHRLSADVGAVFCRSRMILENGTPIFVQWQRAGRYDFDDFLVGNNPARNGSSLLLRKSCFDDVGGFDEDMQGAEDLDMWLRILQGSRTPVLWASRYFLVDLRLRPGSMTRDHATVDAALQKLLERYVKGLNHSPAALAFVQPALAALKYGNVSEVSEYWTREASSAGFLPLIHSAAGARFLFWRTIPQPTRAMLRSLQRFTRDLVKQGNLRARPSRRS